MKRAEARLKLRQLEIMASSGYGRHGASKTKRSTLGWFLGHGRDPDHDITDNLEILRTRSRDLFMGGGLATGSIRTVKSNVIGPGLRLNSQIDSEYLKMTAEEARRWERQAEREFSLWAETTDCDASKHCDFYGLQRLAFHSFLLDGDVFALLLRKNRNEQPYNLRIRLLAGDRVCDPPYGYRQGKDIRGGVEIDDMGAAVAYWICQAHPYTTSTNPKVLRKSREWVRYPAYGQRTGQLNVLHLMDPERIDQRRGVPFLAPVIEDLKQLDRYTEAELMAAVVGGLLTVFITQQAPGEPPFGDEPIYDDSHAIELGHGTVISLSQGEKPEIVDPKRPNAAFDSFVTSMCRQIGSALGIPYEVLVKHFTSSYSASRGALLEAWKFFKTWRAWFEGSFCRPIYETWLDEAVATGRLYAPGFFDDPMVRKAYCSAIWRGPSPGQLNPVQEVTAAKIRVEEGFSTRTIEAAELTGTDWERNHHQRVAEEQARRDGKLIPSQ
ncbi:phage portal protein [Acetomicrobium sp. S15 = DSM 107314]|uniref:phage portal protein n=1 Tax=Acetomicrobium sp. S15 = DSM 107314 TaxID=2529858 RepID=UPI0018E1C5BF|nr:phage portal protein [Acetomicrobium sp. S15 = DSM 107314]